VSCRKVERGVHPDVEVIDLEGQAPARGGAKPLGITIDTVRDVAARSALRPMEGNWRVCVIGDAESMQAVAQEALLKTLEEPPPFTCMLLLTTDAEALLPTVLSRCQPVELRPVPATEIAAALEERGADSAVSAEIAALAQGAPGWAIRAVAEPERVRERLASLDKALEWVEADRYRRLVTAFRLGDGFTKNRTEVFDLVDVTLGIWRDLLLLAAGRREHITYAARSERLTAGADRWTLAEIHRAVGSVRACLADLDANVRARLALEAMVQQWPTP
jgi:DNA polymerase-3 subunit delta'